MKKITYSKVGDFYLPNLQTEKQISLSKWGRMKLNYLKEYEHGLYTSLLFKGELNQYLHEMELQATQMHEQLIKQLKAKYNITESLKQTNQLFWLQQMNIIENIANEIVLNELIYQ